MTEALSTTKLSLRFSLACERGRFDDADCEHIASLINLLEDYQSFMVGDSFPECGELLDDLSSIM